METLNRFEAMTLDLFWEAKATNFEYAKGLRLDFERDGGKDSFNIGIFPARPGEDVFKAWSEPNGVEQEKEKGIVDIVTFAESMLKDVDVFTPIGLAYIIQELADLRKEGFVVGVNSNAYYIHDGHLGMVFWLSSKSPACMMGEFSTVEELKFR